MKNLKLLRQEIKAKTTKEITAQILSFIGYEIDRNYKFKLREEHTSSASISELGFITDFGSGWSGDIVAILHEYKYISLSEATIYVAKLLNIDIEDGRYKL